MSYRFMRVLVLFDLPVLTGDQRREYARFRKFLLFFNTKGEDKL